MRYILKEMVIADLCDQELNDNDVIKDIFNNLKNEQMDFSVLCYIKDGESAVQYDRVRISSVNDDKVDLKIYKNGSILTLKNISIKNFIEIKIITKNSDKYIKPIKNKAFRFLDTE